VTALEEDDWQRLPGRTFARGFARNYARFVRLDPDAVLALLPASMPANATATEVPLVLTFKGTSWAEVKDAKGRVVLQMTGGAGMTQTVSAQPPLELALGNAREVVVTFRGHARDLSAYTRGNVARVSLQ
jgi:cytoskeletal protein RodZ